MEMNSANVEAVVKQVLESMLEKKVPEAVYTCGPLFVATKSASTCS